MKPVTIKSIYGKTLQFRDFIGDVPGRVEVTVHDDVGKFKLGAVFNKDQVESLRDALELPAPVKSDKGVFFLLRQKKEKLSKVKVCFAGMTHTKEYNSRSEAQESARRLSEQYSKWNYFVVEKETV